jgi:hypothetical protein
MKMKLGQNRATETAVNAIRKPVVLTKKLQMNIPEDLHKDFKLACMKQDSDMTEVVVGLIEEWLRTNND